jgi:UDP-N-acetylglucosamine/UDP-N-acetylgalactosamine diphosphorylase
VIGKQDPMEKVGVVARREGRVGIVEYTEIDDEHRFARDDAGELVYWAGNTAIHVFSTAFINRVASQADELLPYHTSAKRIPTVDDEGRPVVPSEPNGLKLERFVFDALGAAERICVVEGERSQDYSPIKSADGSDSPATARRDLIDLYRSWLEAAEIELPSDAAAIEIDHSRVDGPTEARQLGIRRCAEAGDVIRVATGALA